MGPFFVPVHSGMSPACSRASADRRRGRAEVREEETGIENFETENFETENFESNFSKELQESFKSNFSFIKYTKKNYREIVLF